MTSETDIFAAETGRSISDMPEEINASGHVQELDRQFGLLSVCAVGIVTGSSWALMGGTVVSISFLRTGPPNMEI